MDCSEFERKKYMGFVDINNIRPEGLYTIEVGHVPVMEYHAFQEFNDDNNIGLLIGDGRSEDIQGSDLLAELGLEGLIISRDEEYFLAKNTRTGMDIRIASPFYRPEVVKTIDGERVYRTTVVREFEPIEDCTNQTDFKQYRNIVFSEYRDDPFHNSHENEHIDEDNN